MTETTIALLERLRERRPLVHCLTNDVVKNYTANVLLAIGASPAMVEDVDEAAEFAAAADALLVNLGTLVPEQMAAIGAAVASANAAGKPWALDPVAVGPIAKRTRFARELLALRPAVIRGNASEIISLAGLRGNARGTDSAAAPSDALGAARLLAAQTGAAVLVTGETDHAVAPRGQAAVANGHPLMTRVTGVGCAMGALAAACAAVAGDPLDAAVATAVFMGVAGQQAAAAAPRPGSFQIAFLDALDALDAGQIRRLAKISRTP
jgi:hydroxyethylthiazole kinase